MELETQLNASDRNTRTIIGNNFQKIQDEINKIESQMKKQNDIYSNGGGM